MTSELASGDISNWIAFALVKSYKYDPQRNLKMIHEILELIHSLWVTEDKWSQCVTFRIDSDLVGFSEGKGRNQVFPEDLRAYTIFISGGDQ